MSFIRNGNRRLFGQSHLSVYIDGTMRLTVNIRIPPVSEVPIYHSVYFWNILIYYHNLEINAGIFHIHCWVTHS